MPFCRANWHADITFEPVPSDYAILKVDILLRKFTVSINHPVLQVHTLPNINGQVTGGDTLWAR